jgi:hypothetical protein
VLDRQGALADRDDVDVASSRDVPTERDRPAQVRGVEAVSQALPPLPVTAPAKSATSA